MAIYGHVWRIKVVGPQDYQRKRWQLVKSWRRPSHFLICIHRLQDYSSLWQLHFTLDPVFCLVCGDYGRRGLDVKVDITYLRICEFLPVGDQVELNALSRSR